MKGLGAGLKVGLLTLIVAVTGFALWKAVAEQASGSDGKPLIARFHDASGLASKSRVVVAGLTIGEISDRALEGNIARITIKVQRQIHIYSNAVVFKKSSSLLGEFYIDIDPGSPETKNPDGTITKNHELADKEEIKDVRESTGTDQIFRQVANTIPKVDAALEEITGLAKDIRGIVQHQVNNIASNVDKMVAENAKTVTAILDTAERSLSNIERITADIRKVTGKDDLGNTIANLEAATGEAKLLLAEARVELSKTGGIVREKLDKLDKTLDNLARATDSTANITEKIDKDQGTLGRLVNDPTIADNVTDITEDVKGFTSAIGGLQTIVGIRGEYNFFAKSFRSYASIQINTRKDKFYLVELVSDPNGNISKELVYDEATDSWDRRYSASDKFRFSFMLGKRWDMISVRLGIKESSGGIGADLHLFDDDLTVSADLFDWSYRAAPRVKLEVAWRFFQYLYIYAGVDDVFNPRQELNITGDKIDSEADTWSFGLDFFAGAQLKFTDSDLSSLLFVGGSAIAGLAK